MFAWRHRLSFAQRLCKAALALSHAPAAACTDLILREALGESCAQETNSKKTAACNKFHASSFLLIKAQEKLRGLILSHKKGSLLLWCLKINWDKT
jgi:hypothetical protein